jgi:hypothetical protein
VHHEFNHAACVCYTQCATFVEFPSRFLESMSIKVLSACECPEKGKKEECCVQRSTGVVRCVLLS